jgi:mRNA-degrading endonuclease RelE of RelBE toxin-antitoxin system
MPNIRLLPIFQNKLRKFTKRNEKLSNAVKITLRKFQDNQNHPSLHLEKLSGSDIWTIRIDRGNRLFFTWSETKDTAIFFHVGPHDAYKTM